MQVLLCSEESLHRVCTFFLQLRSSAGQKKPKKERQSRDLNPSRSLAQAPRHFQERPLKHKGALWGDYGNAFIFLGVTFLCRLGGLTTFMN
jgi:hypothetical protein